MRRKWRNRLAISTVVANMLMILITISLGAILIAWSGTSYGAFSGGSQVFFQQRGQALQERFAVENVFYNTAPPAPNKQIVVFVRNVGTMDISVVAIYANGVNLLQPGSNVVCITTTTTTTTTAGPTIEAVTTVCQYTFTYTWAAGTIYTIVAATGRGNQVTYVSRAPVGCTGC